MNLIVAFDVARVVLKVLVGVLDHANLPVPIDEVSKPALVTCSIELALRHHRIFRAL